MKATCEEIVIERYLKGNISNEFKDELLWVINARRDNGPYLEILFDLKYSRTLFLTVTPKSLSSLGTNLTLLKVVPSII